MEIFEPDDLLIKKDDGTKWVFMYHEQQVVYRDIGILEAQIGFIVVKPFGEYDPDKIKTLPSDLFVKAF